MNYSNNPGHCELNIFKESGKWYTTEVLDMTDYYERYDGFELALLKHLGGRFMNDDEFIFVCINPYLKYEVPMCTKSSKLKQLQKYLNSEESKTDNG